MGCGSPSGPDPSASGTVTLSTWMYDEPGIGDYWKLVIDEYEKDSGNTVEVRNLPINEYTTQLVVEMSAGNPADIVFIPAAKLGEIAALGRLVDLGAVLEESGVADRLVPGALDYVSTDGVVSAFPVAGRTLDLLYNSELLEQEGFTKPPETPQ